MKRKYKPYRRSSQTASVPSVPLIVKSLLYRRLREAAFITVVALSLFLMLALLTYQPTDAGWTHAGARSEVSNSAGHVGAYLADLLLYLFGYMAYFFPPILMYLGWLAFLKPAHPKEIVPHYILLMIQCASIALLFLIGAAGLSTYFLSNPNLPFTAGGFIGGGIHQMLTHWFNPMGTAIVFIAAIFTALTLLTGFSWFSYLTQGLLKLTIGLRGSSSKAPSPAKVSAPLPEPSKAQALRQPEKPTHTPPVVIQKAPERKSGVSIKTHLSLDLLERSNVNQAKGYTQKQLSQISGLVELKLKDFGVSAQVVSVHPGPIVTRFELQLAAGTKASKVSGLAKDLARSLSVISVRVVEVIEGKSVIGLELPNKEREMVRLRDILSSETYDQATSPLTLGLGKDISGHAVATDLGKMPHLLIAGTTGSGKSVGVNAMLLSLLYKSSPDQLRMILIDPKMLELSIYDGIPHLLTPVVTDMKDAVRALRWCVVEMERRYKLMAKFGVRNLAGFNQKINQALSDNNPFLDPFWDAHSGDGVEEASVLEPLPYIVVVADEFADMMMVVGKKVEELITRIAQKARAAGIHLVLATQRPSVDVITGLIKANIPTRIAFQVSSKIDSRTILDQSGAEQLLGHGDMLYLPPGKGLPIRVHGAFVEDNEVHRVTAELKKQGAPDYMDILASEEGEPANILDDMGFDLESSGEKDALYDQAVQIVLQSRRASISNIQRRLKIGYNRAARLVETMEAAGVVSSMRSNGNREILVPAE